MNKIISSVVVSVMLLGCGGGGGSSLPSSDNSKVVGALVNQYGYFGEGVKFGSYEIAQTWTLINISTSETIRLRFYDDGEFLIDSIRGDYGVSKNGLVIKSDILNDITITNTRKDFYEIQNSNGSIETRDCYDISGGDTAIVMCPGSV